jgi:hypothetical protein
MHEEHTLETPIAPSYWVLPQRLLAGEYPRMKEETGFPGKLRRLLDAGVTTFIDLTEVGIMEPYAQFLDGPALLRHCRFGIPDGGVPRGDALTLRILDAIDEGLRRPGIVYVHCQGGIGRTGLVVGCWLARHGHTGEAALERLRALWAFNSKAGTAVVPENAAQTSYIVQWKEPASRKEHAGHV